MKNSAARKLKQVPEGYLMVGVDPHKKKHAAVAMTQDFMVQSKLKFANSRPGFEEALERARLEMIRTGCRGVMVAIETASHYWRNFAYFLDERGIPFRLINQFSLKRRREGWGRMSIVDTKPFMLPVSRHRIFVHRPQVKGIQAWPVSAGGYRRSRYTL